MLVKLVAAATTVAATVVTVAAVEAVTVEPAAVAVAVDVCQMDRSPGARRASPAAHRKVLEVAVVTTT